MKKIDMAGLQALKNSPKADGPERAEFKADELHCLITDATGNTVLECTIPPRGFKAKEDKRTRRTAGGIGWYADVRGDDAGQYRGFGVTAGLRLSLDGVKVEPGTLVDLTEEDGEEASGARNPLDRVQALLESTGDSDLIGWICQRAGGFFVRNPEASAGRIDAEYIGHTQRIIEDFSNLLRAVSDAIADDGQVDSKEAMRIRDEWRKLKQYGEAFVCACERGLFDGTRG